MDHNHIKNKGIADKYILHQLSEAEENEFEEHLLFCEECKADFEIRLKTVGMIRTNLPDHMNVNYETTVNKQDRRINFYLTIAAVLALLVTVTWFGLNMINQVGSGNRLSHLKRHNKTHIVKKQNDPNSLQIDPNNINNNLLAQAYQKLPEFENYIENPVRSEYLKVITPINDRMYRYKEKIIINWTSEKFKTLNLVVFNNKANIIFEKNISNNYTIANKIKPGLYYWQLETEDETLYTGKFLIK